MDADHLLCLSLQLTVDMREGDSLAQVARFYYQGDASKKTGTVPYELGQDGDESVEIVDFQIVTEIPADQVVRTDGQSVSLKRAAFNRLSKQFSNAVDGVIEKLGVEDDGESDEADEDKDDAGSESEDEKSLAKEEPKQQDEPPRKILRAKRNAPGATKKAQPAT